MKVKEIKAIAGRQGINPGTMKKGELIRAIQKAEGNSDCFATQKAKECNQAHCLWRNDCISAL